MTTRTVEGVDQQTVADTALIVEALATFAGPPGKLETRRERRAWELISELAADLGMKPSALLHLEPYVSSEIPASRSGEDSG